MSLKDVWTDKVDGESFVVEEDINNIAKAVIEAEEKFDQLEISKVSQTTGTDETVVMSQKASSNAFAGALKGTASGEIIVIADASPIEHEMGVKVSGVSDVGTVKVKRYGKNLVSSDIWGDIFEKQEDGSYLSVKQFSTITTKRDLYLPRGIYTISVWCKSDVGTDYRIAIVYEDGTVKSDYVQSTGEYVLSLMVTSGKAIKQIYWNYGSASKPLQFNGLQVEVGDIAKENIIYEPYIESIEYPVSEDGTAESVTSVYPTTTLITDTESAVIDCTYNRDINKAFAALEAAIATNNS